MPAQQSWTRDESDELGSRVLPGDVLYGINTLRAAENFPVSGSKLGDLTPLVKALAVTKKAAARANQNLNKLSAGKAEIIGRVCDELVLGQHRAHLIVDAFQGGGGTSSHMNINEVIANRGLELMGHPCGRYEFLDPIKDVNCSQSTTDVHSTALRVALMQMVPDLERALLNLADNFATKAVEYSDLLKLGRTHLQDAVPMTVGEEFRAFSAAIRADVSRIWPIWQTLGSLNLGGTVVGTGLAAQPDFADAVICELKDVTGLPLRRAEDLVYSAWNTSELVQFSSLLRSVSITLSKIASDLRLLSSGPRGGIGEIALAAVQAGSPLIPGKSNPVIPEMVNQVAFYVAGTDVSVGMAAEAGQLQRNVFEPLIAYCLISNTALVTNAARIFARHCKDSLSARQNMCETNLTRPNTLTAGLTPLVGGERARSVAVEYAQTGALADTFRAAGISVPKK